jgi:DNA invertase Pin-like site-specific DNA recombinase
MRSRFIAYYRVSTDRQGKSGLGLDAQRKAVADFLDGGKWELVGEFTEIETGKRADRPELEKAIAECKKRRAKLIIAKLDRLSRNVAFIATLMERRVDFLCCDNPTATKFTIHILAAVAEFERDAISKRTRDALAVAKAKGKVIGNYERIAKAKREATAARDEAVRGAIADTAHLSTRAAADGLTGAASGPRAASNGMRCRSIVSASVLACDWSITGGLVFGGRELFPLGRDRRWL